MCGTYNICLDSILSLSGSSINSTKEIENELFQVSMSMSTLFTFDYFPQTSFGARLFLDRIQMHEWRTSVHTK